jgi:hypothetical protein
MSTPDTDLVLTLRDTAQDLISQRSIRDQDTFLGQLVVAAVSLVPRARGGGLTRTRDQEVTSSHATTGTVQELDDLQTRLHEGPCVSAADDPPGDGFFLARDLDGSDAARWPRFASHAVEAGIRSVLSTSVISERSGPRTALNLYADEPDAFDSTSIVTAGLFATQVGGLLYGADHAAHLSAAVASRDVIGQAKGILMERFVLDDGEAFEMLVKSSQDTNMKLAAVAPSGSSTTRSAAGPSARHRRRDDPFGLDVRTGNVRSPPAECRRFGATPSGLRSQRRRGRHLPAGTALLSTPTSTRASAWSTRPRRAGGWPARRCRASARPPRGGPGGNAWSPGRRPRGRPASCARSSRPGCSAGRCPAPARR